MHKSRLEAFSDGVFAIAITILVLNITIGDVSKDDLNRSLIALLPKIFSYTMSFLLIGLYWIGHHFYFEKIKMVDGTFVLLNIILLMLISFLPFPTYLIGAYPLEKTPLIIYGGTLLLTNGISFIMLLYLYRNRHLANEHFKDEFYSTQLPTFFWINSLYVLAIICSFFYPRITYVIYILIIFLALKSYVKRINKGIKE